MADRAGGVQGLSQALNNLKGTTKMLSWRGLTRSIIQTQEILF